jgi:hypothetical protein
MASPIHSWKLSCPFRHVVILYCLKRRGLTFLVIAVALAIAEIGPPSVLPIAPLFEHTAFALFFLSVSLLPSSVVGFPYGTDKADLDVGSTITKYQTAVVILQMVRGICLSLKVFLGSAPASRLVEYSFCPFVAATLVVPMLYLKVLRDTLVCVEARGIKLNRSTHRCSRMLVESMTRVWTEVVGRATSWLFWSLSYLLVSFLYKFYLEGQAWQRLSLRDLVGWSWYADNPLAYVGASTLCMVYTCGLSFACYLKAEHLPESEEYTGWSEQTVDGLLRDFFSRNRLLSVLLFNWSSR